MACLLGSQKDEDSTVSEQDLKILQKTFELCDENRDGFLTFEELCEWMQKLDLHITVEGVKEILQEADRNLDGRLDFNEFVEFSGALVSSEHAECSISKVKSSKCCSNEQKVIKNASGGCDSDDPELREAFDVFDKDRSGLISAEELRSTLSGLGLLSSSTSFSRIHSMIRKVDTDGDGEVSFKEFQNMMKESRAV